MSSRRGLVAGILPAVVFAAMMLGGPVTAANTTVSMRTPTGVVHVQPR